MVTGHDKELNGTAPDIVAARKIVKGLAKKIATGSPHEPVVVHLLDNSAVEFTRAYLNARLFDHQPNRETGAPQPRKAAARRRRRAAERDSGTTADARRTSTGGAITAEKPTNKAENDIAKDPGTSSS